MNQYTPRIPLVMGKGGIPGLPALPVDLLDIPEAKWLRIWSWCRWQEERGRRGDFIVFEG